VPEETPPLTTRRFGWGLAAAAALALVLRLAYALLIARDMPAQGDTVLYHLLANTIADGHGYSQPLSGLTGHFEPTSAYPPLYPLFLSFFSLLGFDGLTDHRAISCVLGTAAVVLIGLLGRRIGGPRVGLLAAGIAAIYPQLVMVDGTVVTESLYAPVIALALLLAYRLIDRTTGGTILRAALLGAVIGVATLTRSEGALLYALLVVPACWMATRGRAAAKAPPRERARPTVRLALIAGVAMALVLTPWVIRNYVVQDRVVVLTSNSGLTFAATNCDQTYDGQYTGFAVHQCAFESPCMTIANEIDQADCLRDQAFDYVESRPGRAVVVAGVRVLRLWELYGYDDGIDYGAVYWGRDVTVAKLGLAMYVVLLLLAIPGLVALRRRRVPIWPLLSLAVLVSISAVLSFGFSRYRLAAEIPLTVLAATGLDLLVAAWQRRRHDAHADAGPEPDGPRLPVAPR